MTIKVNTADACKVNRSFDKDVTDISNETWEILGNYMMYNLIKGATQYTLDDCETFMNINFREPKANECQESLVSIVKCETITPSGECYIRREEFDKKRIVGDSLNFLSEVWRFRVYKTIADNTITQD